MRLARKGQTGAEGDSGVSSILAGAVVAAIVLVVGVLLYAKFFHASAETPEEAICRTSILTNSRITYMSAAQFSPHIECAPARTTISTADEERAKRELADAYKACWDRWQRGTLELFSEPGVYCNPCAYVRFSGKRPYLADFPAYLVETPVEEGEMTYAAYLSPASSEHADSNVPPLPADAAPGGQMTQALSHALSTDTEYALLFIYARGEADVGKLKEHIWKNPTRSAKQLAAYSGGGAVIVGGATAIAGLFLPGPGWVWTALVVTGTVAGGAGGFWAGYESGVDLPQWASLAILVPNDAAEIAQWGCERIEQQSVSSPLANPADPLVGVTDV